MYNITLTVFTPTYNRKEKLVGLYESLKNQTDKDFLWLIVDDGSSDDTKTVVDSFISDGSLNIRYVCQKNGGKYKAHNHGVKLCETDLFVCVDSDDTLLPQAVEHTKNVWTKICSDKKLCGIASPKKMEGDEKFLNPPEKGTLMDLYNKGHFSGEAMLVYRTDVLKNYLFPEVAEDKFMSEAVVYNQIDQKYHLFFDNAFLYIGEYQNDGLTRNISDIHKRNPKTTLIMYKNIAAFQTDFIKASKAYASYLAWKGKNKFTEDFCDYKVKLSVKFAGFLLKSHYTKLFGR